MAKVREIPAASERAGERATVTTMAAKEMKRSAIQHTAAQAQCPQSSAYYITFDLGPPSSFSTKT